MGELGTECVLPKREIQHLRVGQGSLPAESTRPLAPVPASCRWGGAFALALTACRAPNHTMSLVFGKGGGPADFPSSIAASLPHRICHICCGPGVVYLCTSMGIEVDSPLHCACRRCLPMSLLSAASASLGATAIRLTQWCAAHFGAFVRCRRDIALPSHGVQRIHKA